VSEELLKLKKDELRTARVILNEQQKHLRNDLEINRELQKKSYLIIIIAAKKKKCDRVGADETKERMDIPAKMSIALTLTSTPPQSSPLTSPVRHEIFPISQYPAEKLDPALETQVLSSYAVWLQQEIKRLQSRLEEQVELRVQLNKR